MAGVSSANDEEQEVSGDRRHGARRGQAGSARRRAEAELLSRSSGAAGGGARRPAGPVRATRGGRLNAIAAARSRRRPAVRRRADSNDEQVRPASICSPLSSARGTLHGGAGDVGAVGRAGVVDGDLVRRPPRSRDGGGTWSGRRARRPRPARGRSMCEPSARGMPRAGDRAADGDQVDDCAGLGRRAVALRTQTAAARRRRRRGRRSHRRSRPGPTPRGACGRRRRGPRGRRRASRSARRRAWPRRSRRRGRRSVPRAP